MNTDLTRFINPVPVRNQAVAIVSQMKTYNKPWLKAAAIQYWIRNNITYISDPTDNEYFAKPEETIATRGGDCEDFSILFCSMCMAVGVRIRIHIVEKDRLGHAFSSIFCENEPITAIVEDIRNFYKNRNVYIGSKEIFTYDHPANSRWLIVDPQARFIGDMQGIIKMGYASYQNGKYRWIANHFFYNHP
jgi:transglutaminase-like putative cysteine protease